MQLRGLSARTQEAYVAAVEQLAKQYRRGGSPVAPAGGVNQNSKPDTLSAIIVRLLVAVPKSSLVPS